MMAENSKIEWTTHTFNPWIGCQKVSPGCDHCYAEALMDTRYGKVTWGPHGERKRTSEANWKLPLRWARQANETRPRVFCASLADVFDNQVPREWRADLFALIEQTPELDWLLLTKRPENIRKMLPTDWGNGYDNVWLGATCEDQKNYDRRWPVLKSVPARVRFISYEPAIGSLRLENFEAPNWIICGGESGKETRYMDPLWAEDLKEQCEDLGVAFFMKQMTDKKPIPDHLLLRQFPRAA
jgi:protein gp37